MAEKFITLPASALDVNNLPTTLTGAILSDTTSITGLSNGTAYRTFVLQNPSPEFTPAAASGLTVTYLGQDVITTDGTSFDFGTKTLGTGKIYVYVGTGNSSGTLTMSIDGSAAALVTDGVTSAEAGAGGRNGRWFVRDITNATGNISATSSVTLAGCAIKWYLVENQTSVVDVAVNQAASLTAPWTLAANVDTVAGGAVLFGWTSGGASGAVDFDTLTGVTRNGTDVDFDSGEWVGAGSATGVSAETSRSVSLGDTDTSRGSSAVVAISLE